MLKLSSPCKSDVSSSMFGVGFSSAHHILFSSAIVPRRGLWQLVLVRLKQIKQVLSVHRLLYTSAGYEVCCDLIGSLLDRY